MEVKQRMKKLLYTLRVPLVLIFLILIGYLASNFYCNHLVRIYDFTVCDGIFVWDSEKEEGTIYVYHPYRETTAISMNTDTYWLVWVQDDRSWAPDPEAVVWDFIEKPPVQQTQEPVTRQDLLARFGDPEIVDSLMTHEYMTELAIPYRASIPEKRYFDESGRNMELRRIYELTPLEGRENLSYAFCKVSGRINWFRSGEQPPSHNYFQY